MFPIIVGIELFITGCSCGSGSFIATVDKKASQPTRNEVGSSRLLTTETRAKIVSTTANSPDKTILSKLWESFQVITFISYEGHKKC